MDAGVRMRGSTSSRRRTTGSCGLCRRSTTPRPRRARRALVGAGRLPGRDDPCRPAVECEVDGLHASEARARQDDRSDRSGTRAAAHPPPRVRVRVHDAAGLALPPLVALLPLEPGPAARPGSGTSTCTPRPVITSAGTRSTFSNCQTTSSRSSSASGTAASSCGLRTGTRTRPSPAGACARRSVKRRLRPSRSLHL